MKNKDEKTKIKFFIEVKTNNIFVSPSDGDFLIGPCWLQRPRTTTRNRQQEARDPGTQEVIREEDLGPRSHTASTSVPNPFSRKGRWWGFGCTSPPLPLPPLPGQAGQRPTTPLHRAYPSPKQTTHLGPASVKPHFGLKIWIRGHVSDTRWLWRVFLAKPRFSTRSDSWAGDQRRSTSALLLSASLERAKKIRPSRYNQDKSMADRYGARVDIRETTVPLRHSATTLGGDHTFRHKEKKHYQWDQRKNRLLWRTCRPNS